MNIHFKSILISVLLIWQLPVFSQNALGRNDSSLFNHYGAYSEMSINNETKKLLVFNSVFIFEDGLNVAEIDKANQLKSLGKLTKRIYAPSYVTFDPSGQFLYVVSGRRNFVTQWKFDPAKGNFVPENNYRTKETFDFQTPCDDDERRDDPFRQLQFVQARDEKNEVIKPISYNRAYITCRDEHGTLALVGFDFDPISGNLSPPSGKLDKPGYANKPIVTQKTPMYERQEVTEDVAFAINNRNGGTLGKKLGEVENPLAISFDPSGKYFYAIEEGGATDKKLPQYVLRQYFFTVGGWLNPTSESIKLDAKWSPVSMTFNPRNNHDYVYVVNTNADGSSIDQYQFNSTDGKLAKFDSDIVPNVTDKASASQIVFSPSGKFAYVLDKKINLIYQYSVDDRGRLNLLNQKTFQPNAVVVSLIFDRSGEYAYGIEFNPKKFDYEIEQFTVEPTGALKKLGA